MISSNKVHSYRFTLYEWAFILYNKFQINLYSVLQDFINLTSSQNQNLTNSFSILTTTYPPLCALLKFLIVQYVIIFFFFVGVFNISTACATEVKNSNNLDKEVTEAVIEYLETADEQEYEEFMELTINYSWKLLPYKKD